MRILISDVTLKANRNKSLQARMKLPEVGRVTCGLFVDEIPRNAVAIHIVDGDDGQPVLSEVTVGTGGNAVTFKQAKFDGFEMKSEETKLAQAERLLAAAGSGNFVGTLKWDL